MNTVLGKIAAFCYIHYRAILIGTVAVLILLCIRMNAVNIETDFLKLFPQEETAFGALLEILQEFTPADKLFLLIEKNNAAEQSEFLDICERFIADLKEIRINRTGAFEEIEYKFSSMGSLQDAAATLSLLVQNPLHFLDYGDIEDFREKLSHNNIFNQVSKNRKTLLSQTSYGMRDIISVDPLEFRTIFEKKMQQQTQGFGFSSLSDYFLSSDNSSLLVIASPGAPAADMQFSRDLVNAVRQTADKYPRVTITVTGANAIAAANEQVIRGDMTKSMISALAGVLLLFFLVYRRFVVLLFVSVPIIMGILFTLTVASFTTGINILTSVFSAVVVGLGIDFSIHLYDRFHCERALGRDTLQALRISLHETGGSILTGGLTTVFAFLSLWFATIRGINEFGFLVAAGIAGCLFATFFVLPALLVWQDRRSTPYVYRTLWSFSLPGLTRFIQKHLNTLLILVCSSTVLAVYLTSRVAFDSSIESLKPKHVSAYAVQDRIEDLFGSRGSELYITHEGGDLDGLVSEAELLPDILSKHLGKDSVLSFNSPAIILNSEIKQSDLLQKLTEGINFEETLNWFDAALEKHEFNRSFFARTRDFLIDAHRSPDSLIVPPGKMVDRLEQSPLSRLINMHIVEKEDTVKMMSHLFLNNEQELSKGMLREIEQSGRSVKITGIAIIAEEILSMAKRDLGICLSIAAFMVALSLWVHFRKISLVLFALVPLLTGFVWMMGCMAIWGIKLNTINLIILPIVIGIGIDDGVHLLQRFLKSGSMRGAITGSGRAVVITSLATIISFGSLIAASHDALTQMGAVVILGISFCLFNSLFALPVLLAFYEKKAVPANTPT